MGMSRGRQPGARGKWTTWVYIVAVRKFNYGDSIPLEAERAVKTSWAAYTHTHTHIHTVYRSRFRDACRNQRPSIASLSTQRRRHADILLSKRRRANAFSCPISLLFPTWVPSPFSINDIIYTGDTARSPRCAHAALPEKFPFRGTLRSFIFFFFLSFFLSFVGTWKRRGNFEARENFRSVNFCDVSRAFVSLSSRLGSRVSSNDKYHQSRDTWPRLEQPPRQIRVSYRRCHKRFRCFFCRTSPKNLAQAKWSLFNSQSDAAKEPERVLGCSRPAALARRRPRGGETREEQPRRTWKEPAS